MLEALRPPVTLLAAILCLTAVVSSGAGAEETGADPRWRALLAEQLKAEKNCHLYEILSQDEMPLGEDIAISGRVSCFDGRLFDFNRRSSHQKFELRACEPTVC